MSKEVMQQALDALDIVALHFTQNRHVRDSITALREALAQPEQGPVAYAVKTVGGNKWHSIHASKSASDKWLEFRIKEQARDERYEQLALYAAPPAAQPEIRTTILPGFCRVPPQRPAKEQP